MTDALRLIDVQSMMRPVAEYLRSKGVSQRTYEEASCRAADVMYRHIAALGEGAGEPIAWTSAHGMEILLSGNRTFVWAKKTIYEGRPVDIPLYASPLPATTGEDVRSVDAGVVGRIRLLRQITRHEKDSVHEVVKIVPHGGHYDDAAQYVLSDGTHVPSSAAILEPFSRPPSPAQGELEELLTTAHGALCDAEARATAAEAALLDAQEANARLALRNAELAGALGTKLDYITDVIDGRLCYPKVTTEEQAAGLVKMAREDKARINAVLANAAALRPEAPSTKAGE